MVKKDIREYVHQKIIMATIFTLTSLSYPLLLGFSRLTCHSDVRLSVISCCRESNAAIKVEQLIKVDLCGWASTRV